jgi:hypothetical protein
MPMARMRAGATSETTAVSGGLKPGLTSSEQVAATQAASTASQNVGASAHTSSATMSSTQIAPTSPMTRAGRSRSMRSVSTLTTICPPRVIAASAAATKP